jgi:paraquat-inducible protein B
MNQQTIEETSPSGTAQAVVQTKKGISIVWVVPLVAILIGGWLAYKAITEKGPSITITFENAEGLEAGKTKIKFKNVEIGQVESIHLGDDLEQVIVTADLVKESESYLTENTRFWVVRARIAGGEVSGLGTLFSGAYIGIDPGKHGKPARSFQGLKTPPIVTTDLPGRHFMIEAATLSSLDIGSPIYYRQFKVGKIVAYELKKDGQAFSIKIFIQSPYHEYVRENSRFYNAGGLDVSLDATGIKVDTESFVTLMIGGIAFETRKDLGPSPAAMEGDTFRLYEKRAEIYEKTYVKKVRWLLNFDGSVRGLSVGAPVEFRGIEVGKVVDMKLEFDYDKMAFRIPVVIELEPGRIKTVGTQEIDRRRGNEILVEKGLRAQLKQGSLLTGQLYIDIDIHHDEPSQEITYDGEYPEIPTIPTPLEEITRSVTHIVDKLDRIPLEQIGNDLRDTMAHLNKSTEQLQKLMKNIDEKVAPAATATLAKTETTLTKVDRLLDAESPTGYEMKRALSELADAAHNINILTEYLGRHPESLVYGKEKSQ